MTAVLGLFGFIFGQQVLLLFTSPMVQWAVTAVSHCFYSSFVQCYCCFGPSDSLLAWKCWFWFYFAKSIPSGSFFVVLQSMVGLGVQFLLSKKKRWNIGLGVRDYIGFIATGLI